MAGKLGAVVLAAVCIAALAGCTTNKSIANVTTPTAKLELAVGTINDSSGTLGLGGTTINVVSSFRNTFGNSAYQNPGQYSLIGPGGTIVASTPGNPCDELFSYGDFPGCESDVNGNPLWGEPPTYNPPDPVGGYSLGFIRTGAAATPGIYTISTSVPVNGGTTRYSATATLPASPVVLPNATGVTAFTTDGKGGGTFTIGNPLKPRSKARGASGPLPTEYLIVVANEASFSLPTTVATVETTSTTATITGTGDCASSVGGSPIPCGPFVTYVVEADYPLVESGPPANTQQAPTLAGPNGTADISASGLNTSFSE